MTDVQVEQVSMADLIRAIRTLPKDGDWQPASLDEGEGVCVILPGASTIGLALVARYNHAELDVKELGVGIVTILNTALDLASLAYALELAEQRAEALHRHAEHETRTRAEYQGQMERQQQAIQEKDQEIAQLRFTLAVGGLERVATCPSCGADRTNGETHTEDCPIMTVQRHERERRVYTGK